MKMIHRRDFVAAADSIPMTPGEMLATLRQLQGLTQGALAQATGMTQANISNMESGRQQIGRDRALALAQPLNVHPAVILFPNYQVGVPVRAATKRQPGRGGLAPRLRRRRAPILHRKSATA